MVTNQTPQLRSLGNGTYRVTGIRVSPTTGRYVVANARAAQAPIRATISSKKQQS